MKTSTYKKNIAEVIIDNNLGWNVVSISNSKVWFKYGLSNNHRVDFFERLVNIIENSKIIPIELKHLLSNVNWHFSIIIQYKDKVIAIVDMVRTIPVYYLDEKVKKISNSPHALVSSNINNLNNINTQAALEISMSGYTIGHKTLYRNLNQITAGECVLIENNKLERIYYYSYSPWKRREGSYSFFKKQLTECIVNTFEELIDDANGRQIAIPLSAGSDSRLVASTLKYLGYKNVVCFAYGRKKNYESTTSQAVAEKLGFRWFHIPLNARSQQMFFLSSEFSEYCRRFDTFASTPFIQDVSVMSILNQNNMISDDAIIVNGNTGDYISGGHIPKSINNHSLSKGNTRYTNNESWLNFLDKNFSLWKVLRTQETDNLIQESFFQLFQDRNLLFPDDIQTLHGKFESMEYLTRQSKYIVNMQRSYELYDYEWSMPLWSKNFLDFWEEIPVEYKLDRKLYKETIIDNNWGEVWENIPLNSGTILPPISNILRNMSKIMFAPFGADAWHSFERNVFQYFLDDTKNSAIVPYHKVLFDRRGQSNWISWWTELYIQSRGLDGISKDFIKKLQKQ